MFGWKLLTSCVSLWKAEHLDAGLYAKAPASQEWSIPPTASPNLKITLILCVLELLLGEHTQRISSLKNYTINKNIDRIKLRRDIESYIDHNAQHKTFI